MGAMKLRELPAIDVVRVMPIVPVLVRRPMLAALRLRISPPGLLGARVRLEDAVTRPRGGGGWVVRCPPVGWWLWRGGEEKAAASPGGGGEGSRRTWPVSGAGKTLWTGAGASGRFEGTS